MRKKEDIDKDIRKIGVIMESLTEPPMYVKCFCNNCGHGWESAAWTGKCPECHSENINQDAMMHGL